MVWMTVWILRGSILSHTHTHTHTLPHTLRERERDKHTWVLISEFLQSDMSTSSVFICFSSMCIFYIAVSALLSWVWGRTPVLPCFSTDGACFAVRWPGSHLSAGSVVLDRYVLFFFPQSITDVCRLIYSHPVPNLCTNQSLHDTLLSISSDVFFGQGSKAFKCMNVVQMGWVYLSSRKCKSGMRMILGHNRVRSDSFSLV